MTRTTATSICTVFSLGFALSLGCNGTTGETETDSEAGTTTPSASTSSSSTSGTSSTGPSETTETPTTTTGEPETSTTTGEPETSTTTGETTSETTENISDGSTTVADPCEGAGDDPPPECCEQQPEFPGCVPEGCQAPETYVQCDEYDTLDKLDGLAVFNVLGLGCPGTDATDGIVITDYSHQYANPVGFELVRGYGDYHIDGDPQLPLLYNGQSVPKLDDNNEPIEGEYSMESDTILLLSTGKLEGVENGYLSGLTGQAGNGDNGNSDTPEELPDPMSNLCGSNSGDCGTPFQDCDGVHDCSDSVEAPWAVANGNPNDMQWLEFTVDVPLNVTGYAFRFAFWTSEWPAFVGSQQFNDMVIGWQVSEVYTGNTLYFPDPENADKALTLNVTTLDPHFEGDGFACLPKFAPNCAEPPQLEGTGFEKHAGTNWMTVRGPVASGEEDVQFGFFIADMSDSILATTVALDSWHWECEGCTLGESCGAQL